MAGQNKIRVEICGSRYVVSSNESPEYVKRLVNTIENKVKTIMDSGPSVTLNDAYFLALLSYADLYEKSELNADHIRSQLTEYLEDSTKAKLEVDEYRRENEKLKREIDILRQNIGRDHWRSPLEDAEFATMDGFLFQPEEGTDNEYGEDDYEYDYESERRAAEQSEQQAVLNAASPEERRE